MTRSPADPRDAEAQRRARSHSEVREKIGDPVAPERRICVLVAEDEDRVRELAINVLDAYGFDAIGARHGGEALALFSQHLPEIDAVLLDLSMPVLDGLSVLDELRRQKPSIPVVVTSGYDDTAAEFEARTVSFLAKPYRAEQLITRLRALLADQADRSQS
jgi:CheY-like chemotaxis protein